MGTPTLGNTETDRHDLKKRRIVKHNAARLEIGRDGELQPIPTRRERGNPCKLRTTPIGIRLTVKQLSAVAVKPEPHAPGRNARDKIEHMRRQRRHHTPTVER